MSEAPSEFQTPPPPPQTGIRKVWEYLKAKEFWALMGIIVGGGLLLLSLFFYLILPIITRQSDTLAVPQVASLAQAKKFVTLPEAIRKLEEVGLSYEVIDSGLFLTDFPPLAVTAQEPEAGNMVKSGRKVYLKVNRSVAPLVKFPNVFDIGFNQARYILENWKLRVGTTTTEPGMGTNLVIRAFWNGKQLTTGDLVPEQAKIDIVISEGARLDKVKMPNLIGVTLETANTTLRGLGLSIANVEFVKDPSQPQGFVVGQRPTVQQDSVQAGSSVWLKVNGTPKQDE